MKKKHTTRQQMEDIRVMASKGMKGKEISAKTGIALATVYRYIPSDKSKATPHLTDEVIAEINKLFNNGMAKGKIAKTLGVSPQSVTRHTPVSRLHPDLNKALDAKIKEYYINNKDAKVNALAAHFETTGYRVLQALKGVERHRIEKLSPEDARNRKKEHNRNQYIKAAPKSVERKPYKKDTKILDVKRLIKEGRTVTYISRELKIGFTTVKRHLEELGLDYKTVAPFIKKDNHTGKISVQLNSRTWAYMDKGRCENEFREFKIKQLGL